MCGLVGIASSNLIVGDRNIFTSLLYIDEIRGEHSTGVCAVDKDGNAHVYKRALKASDFIQLKGYASVLSKGDKVLMGHNRYATMGARDDNNAHPFTHGTVTLMHNGTLTNKHAVNKCTATFGTDSETIAYSLATDDVVQVLERLEGAYALVWYDDADEVLHFARNDERPLYLGRIGNDLVWASEKAMLELVAEHHKKTLSDVQLLPVGKLVMFDIKGLSKDPEVLDFVPKKPAPVATQTTSVYRGGHHYGGRRNYRGHLGKNVVEATLTECRQSGYFEAVADDGSHVQGNLPHDMIVQGMIEASKSGRIRGTSSSESSRWRKGTYQDVYYLTSASIEFIAEEEVADSGTEKKCCLCGSSTIKGLDEMEHHYGEYFHTSCLDGIDGYGSLYGDH